MASRFPTSLYTCFPPPDESNTQEQWIKNLLDGNPSLLKLHRKKIALFDPFPPEYADYYKALQEEIAKRIPSEQERPFICLNIRGKNRTQDNYNADVGLAGGTGPLSDAVIFESLVKQLSQIEAEPIEKNRNRVATQMADFSAVLYSMPPPRDLSHAYNDFYKYRSLFRSIREHSPCTSLHILTNTGHSNKWVFSNRLFFGSNKLGPVDDMTVKIARKIQMESTQGESVLIFGTIAADKDKLYEHLLAKRNLKPILPSENFEGKSAKEYLQSIIDRAKEGKVNENMPDEERTCGQACIDFMVHFARNTGSKSLLFGCTELPMILHTEIIPGDTKTYFDVLQEELATISGDTPYKYYDTEAIFVDEIAKQSQILQANPAMRSTSSSEEPSPTHDLNIILNEIKQDIEKHCNRFIHRTDEKHTHKKNVLLATLEYFEDGNIHKLRQVLRDNPRFAEASMIWGSTTLALVQDGLEIMHQLKTVNSKYSSNRNQLYSSQAEKAPVQSKTTQQEFKP